MFRKIAVAYNESPEAKRALVSAIQLAKHLNADVQVVTVMADLPSYTAYAVAADVSLTRVLEDDRTKLYGSLQDTARTYASDHGVELSCHLIEGHEVGAIVDFLRSQNAELLVVGLHQRDLYIARLWSTVYELAQEAPCSVLGVH